MEPRKIVLLAFLIIPYILCAQDGISVGSFYTLENDLTARVTNPVEDQNGEKCALLKVVTTQTGFSFEGGMLGIQKTVQKDGEIWVYVPKGARRITVKHPELGLLRDYPYPVTINSAIVYEMKLFTKDMEELEFFISTHNEGAKIYVDDVYVGTTEAKTTGYTGKHRIKILTPYHYPIEQEIEIKEDGKVFNLVPQQIFCDLTITSNPKKAKVYFFNEFIGTTPLTLNTDAGIKNVKLEKKGYRIINERLILEGENRKVSYKLEK